MNRSRLLIMNLPADLLRREKPNIGNRLENRCVPSVTNWATMSVLGGIIVRVGC